MGGRERGEGGEVTAPSSEQLKARYRMQSTWSITSERESKSVTPTMVYILEEGGEEEEGGGRRRSRRSARWLLADPSSLVIGHQNSKLACTTTAYPS